MRKKIQLDIVEGDVTSPHLDPERPLPADGHKPPTAPIPQPFTGSAPAPPMPVGRRV